MKLSFYPVFLCLIVRPSFCQPRTTGLQEQVISIDIGVLGSWIGYKKKLHDKFTLNTEAGLEAGLRGGSGRFYYAATSAIRMEPRF